MRIAAGIIIMVVGAATIGYALVVCENRMLLGLSGALVMAVGRIVGGED
jgi:hypothetical protein